MTTIGLMPRWWARALVAVLSVCLSATAVGAPSVEQVRAREGDNPHWSSAAYDDSSWPVRSLRRLDSQDRLIWIRSEVRLPATDQPLAVNISALGAYQLFWNGQMIGASGSPGRSKAQERPGNIDGHFPIPKTAVRDRNLLAIRISTFHLPYRMAQPLQRVSVSSYEAGATAPLRSYLGSIAAAGMLALAAIYFAFAYLMDRTRRGLLLLALISASLLGQLSLEVVRGFISYSYPLHVLRMGGIFLFSGLSGALIIAYVGNQFLKSSGRWLVWLSVGWSALCAILFAGFDYKTSATILGSTAIVAAALTPGAERGSRGAIAGLFGCAAVVLSYFSNPVAFLDRNFYVVATIALSILLLHHLRIRGVGTPFMERPIPDLVESGRLPVVSARGIDLVEISQIVAIHGADDYAEITTTNGPQRLYRGRLTDLETSLPANFLRVHRSHLVNVDHVSELVSSSGSLKVRTSSGVIVPVSRSHSATVRKLFSTTRTERLAPTAAEP